MPSFSGFAETIGKDGSELHLVSAKSYEQLRQAVENIVGNPDFRLLFRHLNDLIVCDSQQGYDFAIRCLGGLPYESRRFLVHQDISKTKAGDGGFLRDRVNESGGGNVIGTRYNKGVEGLRGKDEREGNVQHELSSRHDPQSRTQQSGINEPRVRCAEETHKLVKARERHLSKHLKEAVNGDLEDTQGRVAEMQGTQLEKLEKKRGTGKMVGYAGNDGSKKMRDRHRRGMPYRYKCCFCHTAFPRKEHVLKHMNGITPGPSSDPKYGRKPACLKRPKSSLDEKYEALETTEQERKFWAMKSVGPGTS